MATYCRVRAPLRVDFTGGYTDIEPQISSVPSVTVNAAIDKYVTAAGRRSANGLVTILVRDPRGRRVQAGPGPISQLATQNGLVRTITRIMSTVGIDADLEITADLPVGCGVGASGAITVAVCKCLFMLSNRHDIPLISLPHFAATIERLSGHAGGIQDQMAATFGGFKGYIFREDSVECRDLSESTSLLHGMMIAIPSNTRNGGSVVRSAMAEITSKADSVSGHAIRDLAKLGGRLIEELSREDDRALALPELVTHVLHQQRLLHPSIDRAIVQSPFWPLIRANQCTAKPLGGAGSGAAWVIIPPVVPAVRSLLLDKGWFLVPAEVDPDGARVDALAGE